MIYASIAAVIVSALGLYAFETWLDRIHPEAKDPGAELRSQVENLAERVSTMEIKAGIRRGA